MRIMRGEVSDIIRPPGVDTSVVRGILEDVKRDGDRALLGYTERFDHVVPEAMEVSRQERRSAYEEVDDEDIGAIREAAAGIIDFARWQFERLEGGEMERRGVRMGQFLVPVQGVGCYVPGGRYPLPSSALMSIIPARVAGVSNVIVCTPGAHPATVVAADIAGADRIFRVGGAQAIGAMAYGTATIPAVDMIVGPGNAYVTAAKREVFGRVGVDMLAGPSELMVIADGSSSKSLIAADLLAQAEHDPGAMVWLVTDSEELAIGVDREIGPGLERLGTAGVARRAMENATVYVVVDMDAAVALANRVGPEHLELQVTRPGELVERLVNYGSLFIGEHSAEVFGDYCSGPDHILPTGSSSRYRGGLNVLDFLKVLTFQQATADGARRLAPTAARLARLEGLDAHAEAARLRM